MTPELLARAQDEKTVDAASDEWEKALERYTEHLRAIWPKLPRSARRLARRVNLHDAVTLLVGIKEASTKAMILLHLDEPGDQTFVILYDLLKKMEWFDHSSLTKTASGGDHPLWLYDEFDVVEENDIKYFTHSILFSNGWELKLSFRGMYGGRIKQFLNQVRALSREDLQTA